MGGEWREVPLGELVQNFDSRRVPQSSREREKRPGPFPYYGATGVMDYVDDFIFEGLHLLVAEDGSVETSAGKPFLQLVDGKFWVNNHAHVLKGKSDEETRFLFYALSTIAIRPFMSGSVQAKLSQGNLNKIPVQYPADENTRLAIAHILGTLDDKIELNRKQNETLEAMARALFKAWFVDFEPVRAKIEGRWQRGQSLPGLPAHLYDLFPDRLVESELGEIPEGWEIVPASKLIEFNPSEPLRKGIEAPYIEMASLPTSGSWPDPVVPRPFGSGMRFRNGDTLLARITPCLENGKTAFVQCLPENTVGWGSTEFIVMRPKAPVPPELGYLLARHAAFREQAIRSMTGTSGRQRVQADSLAAYKISAPSNSAVWNAFSRVVAPAFRSIKTNAETIATLAQLRDTLLPKLISGALRVKDAERFLEART
jgi:type I restriction enzyme S subunit